MYFTRTGKIYKVVRRTNSNSNILGVVFDTENKNKNEIEVIEWYFPDLNNGGIIEISKEEVLEYVLDGLEAVNKSLGTDYQVSQIYFTPFDDPPSSVYRFLITLLIRHYHSGNEFFEL